MLYTINELTDKVCEDVYKVYEVFKNFFGEDYVDLQHFPSQNEILHNMQPSFVDENNVARYEVSDVDIRNIKTRMTEVTQSYMWIMVYWPEVTVTNEHDKSVKIQDLYAKINLTMQGTIPYEYYFLLNRATYPTNQFASGYMHSHICCIPTEDFSEFQTPCLGRGPIKQTIQTLNTENDEVEWMLFCQELALYVTVESLTGGPYNKLEEIGSFYDDNDFKDYVEANPNNFSRDIRYFRDYLGATALKEFIEYYLKYGHLRLSYVDNSFTTAMQFYDFIVDISNCFINWFNVYKATERDIRNCINGRLIFQRYAVDRSIKRNGSNHSVNIGDYEGEYVCDFKGRRITLHIISLEEMEDSPTPITLLSNRVSCQILDRVVKVLNYRFRNERNQDRGEEECKTPALSEKVRYI